MNRISEFVYPISRYYGEQTPDNLLFHANLQEFGSRVSLICSLATGGKLSLEECFDRIVRNWDDLQQKQQKLAIEKPSNNDARRPSLNSHTTQSNLTKSKFIHASSRYYGKQTPENIEFHGYLQEFASRVSIICSLATGGKLSLGQAFADIDILLWDHLASIEHQLRIGIDSSKTSQDNVTYLYCPLGNRKCG